MKSKKQSEGQAPRDPPRSSAMVPPRLIDLHLGVRLLPVMLRLPHRSSSSRRRRCVIRKCRTVTDREWRGICGTFGPDSSRGFPDPPFEPNVADSAVRSGWSINCRCPGRLRLFLVEARHHDQTRSCSLGRQAPATSCGGCGPVRARKRCFGSLSGAFSEPERAAQRGCIYADRSDSNAGDVPEKECFDGTR